MKNKQSRKPHKRANTIMQKFSHYSEQKLEILMIQMPVTVFSSTVTEKANAPCLA